MEMFSSVMRGVMGPGITTKAPTIDLHHETENENEAPQQPEESSKQTSAPSSYIIDELSIEEFEARFAATRAERERNGFHSKKQSKVANVANTRVFKPLSDTPMQVVPQGRSIPLGKARTAEHVIELYRLAQEHKLAQPEIEFGSKDVRGAQDFTIRLTLRFLGEADTGAGEAGSSVKVLEDQGPFRSKKEAKEAVAQRGVEAIKEMVSAARAATMGVTPLSEKIVHTQGMEPMVNEIPNENFVGRLAEYCTAESLPLPVYQFYSVTLHIFACEVTVELESSSEEREYKTFGSSTRPTGTKKAAKARAASAAVEYLRGVGLMRNGSEPVRKKVRVKSPVANRKSTCSDSGENGLEDGSKDYRDGDVTTAARPPTTLLPGEILSNTDILEPNVAATNVARAHALKLQLGLSNLQYLLDPALNTALYSGAAYFPDEPRLSELKGPLGEVHGIYGKKNAKEEIAKGLVKVLEALVATRLAG